MPLVEINDGNYADFCEGGVHAVGRGFGYIGRKAPFGAILRPLLISPLIPRSEWPKRIADLYNSKRDLRTLADAAGQKCKDQDGLGYCWAYGTTEAQELHEIIEQKPYVELSPESVGGPCTGWRNEGGYAEEAAKQLEKFGACEESYMDSPNSLRPKAWKAGWEQNALLHTFEHSWYDVPGDLNTTVTILLGGTDGVPRPVAAGLTWWGHLVCYYAPAMWVNGKLWKVGDQIPTSNASLSYGVLFRNSWGESWGENGYGTLTENKAISDGAAMPWTAVPTPPDPVPPTPPEPAPYPPPTPVPPQPPTPPAYDPSVLKLARKLGLDPKDIQGLLDKVVV